MSFALSVTIPEAISSDASLSNVARALEGEEDTTVWMCRLTRIFKSSLYQGQSKVMPKAAAVQTHIGILSGSPLNRGST